MTWGLVLGLAAGSYALKAAGPLLLGGRRLPAGAERALLLVAVALLAALVAVSTLGAGRGLALDSRVAGLAAAAGALALRAPFPVVVGAAALTTALLRLAGAP